MCHIVILDSPMLGHGTSIHVATADGARLVAASLADHLPGVRVTIVRDVLTPRHEVGDRLIRSR